MSVENTRCGFICRDQTGKIIATVDRLASSQVGERRRWYAFEIRGANGDRVQVTCTPRTTTVVHKKQSKS